MTDTPTDGLGMATAAVAGGLVLWIGLGDPVGFGAGLILFLGLSFLGGAGLFSVVSRVIGRMILSAPGRQARLVASLTAMVPSILLGFSTSATVHWIAVGGPVVLSRFGRGPRRRLWRDLTIALVATMGLMLAWS